MIIALVVAMSIASPYFLTAANFKAMIVGLVPTAIIVVGMTILLVSGSFDLSVGSTLALSSTVVAILLLVGLTNGLIVTLLRVNPLIATLGTMSVGRRVALVFTDGFSLTNLPAGFAAFGKTEFLGLPLMAWIMVVIIAVGDFALRRTRFLRQVNFIGGNEKAALLSAIAVDRVRVITFVISGALAAVAGVMLASQLIAPKAGRPYDVLRAI